MSASRSSRWSLFSAAGSHDEALRERDAILTMAEQSAGIGVWDIDLNTSTARGTPQFFRIMGLEPTAEAVPIERFRALRHPEDRERVVSGFREALENGRDAYEMEYRIVRPDGAVRWVFGRGRVVRDAHGKPVRYSGVDIDITERKETAAALAQAKALLERANEVLEQRVRERTAALELEAKKRAEAEARLHQAQKMEAVGQLTGGVAHDFNNILQVIMGNLELLRRTLLHFGERGAAPAARELWLQPIDTALQATRNAAQLTHRLLAFSRLQPLEPALLDVNQLVTDMSVIVRHTLGETVSLETSLAPGLWPAFADRNQLETALLNLVVNARDAMGRGGRLSIETTNIEVADPYPATLDELQAGEYVVLGVSDSGCGIPAEILGKVFEPFFTTKETGKGSGLGLSMVYGFVKQSGGHVRIHSRVGEGTTVRLYLPRAKGAVGPERETVRSEELLPRARPGETVLVVEDNDEVRRYAVSALLDLGYRVLQAADGNAALVLLEAAAVERVDLLFTDMVLPGGMTGRELAERVRARFPGLPVLFATGYSRDAAHSLPERAAPLLAKPYDLESLSKGVRQGLDS